MPAAVARWPAPGERLQRQGGPGLGSLRFEVPLGFSGRCPFSPLFSWEGSPTKIDYRKKGTLILTSLLEGPRPCVGQNLLGCNPRILQFKSCFFSRFLRFLSWLSGWVSKFRFRCLRLAVGCPKPIYR